MVLGMPTVVVATRILLALVLVCDLPIIIEILAHLATGGPGSAGDWVAHVALMGRPLFATIAEQRQWIKQGHVVFSVMLVLPLMLYFLQRWLASRSGFSRH